MGKDAFLDKFLFCDRVILNHFGRTTDFLFFKTIKHGGLRMKVKALKIVVRRGETLFINTLNVKLHPWAYIDEAGGRVCVFIKEDADADKVVGLIEEAGYSVEDAQPPRTSRSVYDGHHTCEA